MVREQREKIQNGWEGDKGFEGEGGVEVLHWQMGSQIEQWRYTNWRSPRRKSQCYQKEQGCSRRAAPGVRGAKSSEFREGKL